MNTISENKTDVAIVGGGLAGLSLSILLARAGAGVVVFEKEKYPHHKVCGEYISMESWGFLNKLGLNPDTLGLPVITDLTVSSPSGKSITHTLDPGGYGISRYLADENLYKLALESGVTVIEDTKVEEVIREEDLLSLITSKGKTTSRVVVCAYGKRANLDLKWKRKFISKKPNKLNNYIGVKYHIEYDHPAGNISLHNFDHGYCGISAIEGNRCCLCYLTKAENLSRHNNSIAEMEREVLRKNPHLDKIFSTAKFLWNAPLTISQISFDQKDPVENNILFIGDAAGMIAPLCGNGMSMALQSAVIAFENIQPFLAEKITRKEMEVNFNKQWKANLAKRLIYGRMIQSFFGKKWLTEIFVRIIKTFPWLGSRLIKMSHGKSFG